MTMLPLLPPPADGRDRTGRALATAVAIPVAVAMASPHAHDWLVAVVLVLVGTALPVYVLVAPIYRWLFSDDSLAAGFLRNVDPRLAFIALRTDVAPRARPLVSVGLVLACVLGFVAVDDPWLYGFQTDVPADWPWTLWLSLWLHADLAHLVGNLLFLWPMAAALEGRIPRARLVFLFVAAGVAGNAASLLGVYAWGDEFSSSIGASGAISGLIGLVVVRCGFARVAIGVPLPGAMGLSPARVRIPVPLWAGLYFAIDLSAALGARANGIGYWAHVGGYLFGVTAALALGLHRAAAREHIERRALADSSPDGSVSADIARDALLTLEPNHVEARIARARETSRGARPEAAASDYIHAIHLLLRTQRKRAATLFVEYHSKYDAPLPLREQLALTPALAALGEHDRAARALADAAHAPDADPALCRRALLQEGRLLEAIPLADAARRRYQDLLIRYPESAEAELATARLARLSERTGKCRSTRTRT